MPLTHRVEHRIECDRCHTAEMYYTDPGERSIVGVEVFSTWWLVGLTMSENTETTPTYLYLCSGCKQSLYEWLKR